LFGVGRRSERWRSPPFLPNKNEKDKFTKSNQVVLVANYNHANVSISLSSITYDYKLQTIDCDSHLHFVLYSFLPILPFLPERSLANRRCTVEFLRRQQSGKWNGWVRKAPYTFAGLAFVSSKISFMCDGCLSSLELRDVLGWYACAVYSYILTMETG